MKTIRVEILVVIFLFVILIVGTGYVVIKKVNQSVADNTWVLHCVDKNNNEHTKEIIGDKSYIKAVEECRNIMFEPVDYYITK